MEQNNYSERRQAFFQSPGMRIWLLIALNFGCTGVFVLLSRFDNFSWLAADADSGLPSWMGKLSNGIYTLMVFVLPMVIFTNAVVEERFESFRLNIRVRPAAFIMAVIAMMVSVYFIDYLYTMNRAFFTDPASEEVFSKIESNSMWVLEMPNTAALLLCLLCQALVPAFGEELFFRAGIQQLAVQWLRKPHAAVLLSAAFFSFMHFDGTGFIARFIMGAFLGYLFYWSGSLLISIAAHFAFNAFSIIDAFAEQHYPDSLIAGMENTPILAVMSAVVALGALFTARALMRRQTNQV